MRSTSKTWAISGLIILIVVIAVVVWNREAVRAERDFLGGHARLSVRGPAGKEGANALAPVHSGKSVGPAASSRPGTATGETMVPEGSDSVDNQDHLMDSHQELTSIPGTIELTARTAAEMRDTIFADCHGQQLNNCEKLLQIFIAVLESADKLDDGWSTWMEDEIARSLREAAATHKFTQIGVKCSSRGCVFFVSARSAEEMFGNGWKYYNDFDRWLVAQHWNQWLETNTRKNGEKSSLAWRVVGLRTEPFVNWYIVTKKE